MNVIIPLTVFFPHCMTSVVMNSSSDCTRCPNRTNVKEDKESDNAVICDTTSNKEKLCNRVSA